MQAALLTTPGQPLEVTDVDIEEPGHGQVRVAVKYCGCCHSDLSIIDGAFPAGTPIVLGHEASGVVDELGPGVDHLEVGDQVVLSPIPPCGRCYWCVRGEASSCKNVMALMTNQMPSGRTGLSRGDDVVFRGLGVGAFADYVVTEASGAVKIPADVPLDVACVIGCAVQTGVGAVLNTAQVEEGATVVVMGLGGIGISVVQGARLAGAARIIVSDPVADRREAAAHFGATDFIDPVAEDMVGRVHELTGVGADYAFEAAGHAVLVSQGVQAIRSHGTVVCVGAPAVTEAIEIAPASLFVLQEKRIMGTALGGSHALYEIPRLVSLWQSGRLDLESMITARRPLAQINEAMDDLRASKGIRTVLEI